MNEIVEFIAKHKVVVICRGLYDNELIKTIRASFCDVFVFPVFERLCYLSRNNQKTKESRSSHITILLPKVK